MPRRGGNEVKQPKMLPCPVIPLARRRPTRNAGTRGHSSGDRNPPTPTGLAAKTRNPNRPNRKQPSDLPVTAVPDTECCCDGMITLQVDQLDNYQCNAYGTTEWATDYAGRNPVEGVNGMIKNDGSFDRESCRAFRLAAHTHAALMAAVVHNLEQTRRTKNRNNITASRPEQATPDTTPPDTPTPHTADPTPTRAPP